MSNQIRLACDRCREQKLRCQRGDRYSNDACTRCRRADALCITGSPRPLGRPRTKGNARGAIVASLTRPGDQTGDHAGFDMSSKGDVTAADMIYENLLQDSSNLLHELAEPYKIPNYSTTNSQTSTDGFLNFQMPAATDDLLYMSNATLDTPEMSLFTDVATTSSRDNELATLQQHSTEVIIKLSQLNETIARHKTLVEAYSWAVPNQDHGLCAGTAREVEQTPMAQALLSASEFNAILEWLMSLSTSFNSSSAPARTDSEICHSMTSHHETSLCTPVAQPKTSNPPDLYPFSKPIMLLLLSSYLQIIELYATIFGHVSRILEGIHDKTGFFQRSPEFRFEGIPPMKARRYLGVMVAVNEDHLHTTECLMGIPPEFCLSTQTRPTPGIFSGVDSQALLRLVLGEAGDGRGQSGTSSAAVQLKESLQTLHRLLPA